MTSLAKLLRPFLPVLSASALAVAASGQTTDVVCHIDGAQQGTNSAGTGLMTGTVDLGTQVLTFDLTFSGLSSNQTAAHIHQGVPGLNGGIHFNIGTGQQTGTTWAMSAPDMQLLLDGILYVNIHTVNFPGGEIRGQITPAPETYCLCAAGPCGNNNAGGGCINNTGSGSTIQVDGQASVALDTLTLTATNVPSNQFGIFYMGPNQISNPFGNGLRCVGGTVHRFPLTNSGTLGEISLGPGIVAFTTASFPANGQIQAGDVWNLQCWYRDPGGSCGASFNLSTAVAVTFTP